MRDEETGSWWQQASGQAIFGALKGESLELGPYDELSFGLWKQESPAGQVLAPVSKDEKEYESGKLKYRSYRWSLPSPAQRCRRVMS